MVFVLGMSLIAGQGLAGGCGGLMIRDREGKPLVRIGPGGVVRTAAGVLVGRVGPDVRDRTGALVGRVSRRGTIRDGAGRIVAVVRGREVWSPPGVLRFRFGPDGTVRNPEGHLELRVEGCRPECLGRVAAWLVLLR